MEKVIEIKETLTASGVLYQTVADEALQVFHLLEPGIYFDIPAKFYHQLPYASNSYLTKVKHCPATAQLPDKPTEAKHFGRAFHTYLIEPNLFQKEFFPEPDIDKRTKIGQRLLAEAILDNPKKDMVKIEDAAKLKGMNQSVQSHPFARDLLKRGRAEVTLIWDHVTPSGFKIRMKARIDWIPEGIYGDCLVDLKSTKSAEQFAFQRSIIEFGYYRQGAIYLDGINTLAQLYYEEGLDFPFPGWFEHFVFIAVEKDGAFRTECYELDPELLEFGQNEYCELLEIERACREAKGGPVYPAYRNAGLSVIGLPNYMKPQHD